MYSANCPKCGTRINSHNEITYCYACKANFKSTKNFKAINKKYKSGGRKPKSKIGSFEKK